MLIENTAAGSCPALVVDTDKGSFARSFASKSPARGATLKALVGRTCLGLAEERRVVRLSLVIRAEERGLRVPGPSGAKLVDVVERATAADAATAE